MFADLILTVGWCKMLHMFWRLCLCELHTIFDLYNTATHALITNKPAIFHLWNMCHGFLPLRKLGTHLLSKHDSWMHLWTNPFHRSPFYKYQLLLMTILLLDFGRIIHFFPPDLQNSPQGSVFYERTPMKIQWSDTMQFLILGFWIFFFFFCSFSLGL